MLFNMGELRESLKVGDEVHTRRQSIQGDASEPLSMTVNSAERLVRLGRPQEAIDLTRTAVALARSSGNSLWLLRALNIQCTGYLNLGQLPEAESTLHELKAALERGSATDPHFRGMVDRREARASLDLAARAELALGRPVDAERFARQAVAMAEAVARQPDTSADVGEALLLLAKAEIVQGRNAEAQPLLERATRCLTNGLGAEHDLSREALTLANRNRA